MLLSINLDLQVTDNNNISVCMQKEKEGKEEGGRGQVYMFSTFIKWNTPQKIPLLRLAAQTQIFFLSSYTFNY